MRASALRYYGVLDMDLSLWPEVSPHDPYRPRFHFLPPRNWMNDPNGLVQINGEYHLFYQHSEHNPLGPLVNRICWGHAKSRDLVRWEHLPVAIHGDTPYDGSGVWSGCIVNDGGTAKAYYTGVASGIKKAQTQCLATSADLIDWKKYEGNPIISRPPAGVNSLCFRDPYIFRYDGRWMMAVGASAERKGTILLYSSSELTDWKYEGRMFSAESSADGWMWECPNFFEIGDKWVLIVSLMSGEVRYYAGEFNGRKFIPEKQGKADFGSCFYAPQVFFDESGRALMFGWLKENRAFAALSGWQGVMSLPREVTLDSGDLAFRFTKELSALEDEVSITENASLTEKQLIAGHSESNHFELSGDFEFSGGGSLIVEIRHSLKGKEKTIIRFDSNKGVISLDRSRSSLNPFAKRSGREACLNPHSYYLNLHVVVDSSVIEIIANSRVCMASRIYPLGIARATAGCHAEGGSVKVKNLKFKSLK